MATLHFIEEGHEYRLEDGGRVEILPSVTTILKDEGFIDTTWYNEDARIRGQYVHQAVHLYDIGDLDEEGLDDGLRGYLEGWKKFLGDTGFQVINSELPLYHHIYRYAGTPDKDGVLNGSPSIIDIKTGPVQPWTALQLAAYTELTGAPRKRYGIYLPGDGTYKLTPPFTDRTDRDVFLSALACWKWKRRNKK